MNDLNKPALFVTYCRVSTREQGISGLGLEAQLSTCRAYVERAGGTIIGEFHDVKSGSCKDRKGLNDALNMAKTSSATVVFSRLDRLSRESEYALSIRNSGVQLYFCDFPQINSLLFSILIAVAQYEKELGQKRTKDALNQIRANIKQNGYHTSKAGNAVISLGKPKGCSNENAVAASVEARIAKIGTDPVRRRQWLLIKDLRSRGDKLDAITATLNATGETAPKGGLWTKAQVSVALSDWGKYFKQDI